MRDVRSDKNLTLTFRNDDFVRPSFFLCCCCLLYEVKLLFMNGLWQGMHRENFRYAFLCTRLYTLKIYEMFMKVNNCLIPNTRLEGSFLLHSACIYWNDNFPPIMLPIIIIVSSTKIKMRPKMTILLQHNMIHFRKIGYYPLSVDQPKIFIFHTLHCVAVVFVVVAYPRRMFNFH